MTESTDGLRANAFECMNSIRMTMDSMLFSLDCAHVAIEDGVAAAAEGGDLDRFWTLIEIAFQRLELHLSNYRIAVQLAETLAEVNRYGSLGLEMGDVVLWDPFPVVELYDTVITTAMTMDEHMEVLRSRSSLPDAQHLVIHRADFDTVDDAFLQAIARVGGTIRRLSYAISDVDHSRARMEAYL